MCISSGFMSVEYLILRCGYLIAYMKPTFCRRLLTVVFSGFFLVVWYSCGLVHSFESKLTDTHVWSEDDRDGIDISNL